MQDNRVSLTPTQQGQLLDVLTAVLREIRQAAWQADYTRCALLADCAHNLPDLIVAGSLDWDWLLDSFQAYQKAYPQGADYEGLIQAARQCS